MWAPELISMLHPKPIALKALKPMLLFRGLNNYLYYLGLPYYNYSYNGPKAIFLLLRPLSYKARSDHRCMFHLTQRYIPYASGGLTLEVVFLT